jgi:hypothetical protein
MCDEIDVAKYCVLISIKHEKDKVLVRLQDSGTCDLSEFLTLIQAFDAQSKKMIQDAVFRAKGVKDYAS